jgi:hypothetical protein
MGPGLRRGDMRCVGRESGEQPGVLAPAPPPGLPHPGGGVGPVMWRDIARGTLQHLPLDGGGWEGVTLRQALELDRDAIPYAFIRRQADVE